MPEANGASFFLEAVAKEKLKKKEKIGNKAKQKPEKISPELLPPIYRRVLPPLPQPPKVAKLWPMPMPPRPPARPPEAEAFAPYMAPVPTPFPPTVPIRPIVRPIIIRPVTMHKAKLDLGKLNPLIADETITVIQCDGANLPLKIAKERRIEEISFVLGEEEIKSVIRRFSDATGQPVTEPFFKVSVANLTFSAQISAFAGSRFVIAKVS